MFTSGASVGQPLSNQHSAAGLKPHIRRRAAQTMPVIPLGQFLTPVVHRDRVSKWWIRP